MVNVKVLVCILWKMMFEIRKFEIMKKILILIKLFGSSDGNV